MVSVGDRVRLHPRGKQVFLVVEVRDECNVVVESVDDTPGTYPFAIRSDFFVAESAAPAES